MIWPEFEHITIYSWQSQISHGYQQFTWIYCRLRQSPAWPTTLFGRIPAILFTHGIRYPDTALESHNNSVQIMYYLYGVYYEKKHLLVISLNMNRSSKYRGMPSVSPPDICRNETFDKYPGIKPNMCAIHICWENNCNLQVKFSNFPTTI
jgi:hypothetical protein